MGGEGERWLVRAEGHAEPRVAWMFLDEDREWLERTADADPAVDRSAASPRVADLRERVARSGARVRDRRRSRSAARDGSGSVTDPIERERWSVAQVIAIGDGLATMRQRDHSFVHRRIEPDSLFVDEGGHARLRAPIAMVAQGPRPSYMGAAAGRMASMASMSPEQGRGFPLTPASDVFALAGNLFAGSPAVALPPDNDFHTLKVIVADAPPPLVTHASGLAPVIARGFEKDPAKRYPDPGTFAGDCGGAFRTRPTTTSASPIGSSRGGRPRCLRGWPGRWPASAAAWRGSNPPDRPRRRPALRGLQRRRSCGSRLSPRSSRSPAAAASRTPAAIS